VWATIEPFAVALGHQLDAMAAQSIDDLVERRFGHKPMLPLR